MSVYVFLTKSWQDFFPRIVSQSNNSQKLKLNGDITPRHHQVELTVTSVIFFGGEVGRVRNRIVELSNVLFFWPEITPWRFIPFPWKKSLFDSRNKLTILSMNLSVMLISGRQLLQMEWDKRKTLTGKMQSWKGSATREVHTQRWGECWVPTGGGCCVDGAESKDGYAPNSNLRLLPQATLLAFQVPSKDTSFQADVASVITKETTLVEKRWSEQASKRQNTKGKVINISWRMNH